MKTGTCKMLHLFLQIYILVASRHLRLKYAVGWLLKFMPWLEMEQTLIKLSPSTSLMACNVNTFFVHDGLDVCLKYTVVAIGKFTSPVLWSKSAIFREVYHYIKMHAWCWATWIFIPNISSFKRGIKLCFCSRGSKVISHNRNVKCLLLRKYKHSNFEDW